MPSVISDVVVLADAVAEAHSKADLLARAGAQLLRDARGDGARGDAPRLRVRDHARPRPRFSARQILGSCVVLPEPVSPHTMTT